MVQVAVTAGRSSDSENSRDDRASNPGPSERQVFKLWALFAFSLLPTQIHCDCDVTRWDDDRCDYVT
jgi:hypothetical protein